MQRSMSLINCIIKIKPIRNGFIDCFKVSVFNGMKNFFQFFSRFAAVLAQEVGGFFVIP